jgi:ribose 5-phosphate isomerase A
MAINPKQIAGEKAAEYVQDGMIVGLGTGSTAYFAIAQLGRRVAQGLRIQGIPTSEQSRTLAEQAKIPLIDFDGIDHIDITVDGADEIDPAFHLTKGGGGALLREKIVASLTQTEIIVADETKLVKHLGAFPLPVEVVPFGFQATMKKLAQLECTTTLRHINNTHFVTDNGNYIIDCAFGRILHPPELEKQINAICGVVECGLFIGLTHRLIIGKTNGTFEECTQAKPLEES